MPEHTFGYEYSAFFEAYEESSGEALVWELERMLDRVLDTYPGMDRKVKITASVSLLEPPNVAISS